MPISRFLRCLMLLGMLPIATAGGQAAGTLVEAARQEIEELNLDAAVSRLGAALGQRQQLTEQQLVRAYTLLGIAEASRGKADAAQAAFHEALWLDPELRVDSLTHLSSELSHLFGDEKLRWSAILQVSSEPPGAEVSVASQGSARLMTDPTSSEVLVRRRAIGRTPLERRVPSGDVFELRADGGKGRTSVHVAVPEGRLVALKLYIPDDTLPWPAQTEEDLRREFLAASQTQWTPSKPPPDSVRVNGSYNWVILGGVVGLVGAVALLPAPKYDLLCTTGSNGLRSCVSGPTMTNSTLRFAVFLGGVTAGLAIGIALDEGKMKRARQHAEREYVSAMTAWQINSEEERRLWVDERVRQARELQNVLRQGVMDHNAAVRARNASLPEPRVSIERLQRR